MNPSDPPAHTVLAALGLPGLRIVADPGDVAALEQHPGCNVPFAEALRLALEAFLSDGRGSPAQGHDSALDIVRSAPESFGLDTQPDDAAIRAALHRLLADDPQAQIILLTPTTIKQPAYRFLPEYGESMTDNWIFRIIAPAGWPFLQWAIVDLRGDVPAYSYSFD